jgi:membrane-bound lytic murein transglycosylase B
MKSTLLTVLLILAAAPCAAGHFHERDDVRAFIAEMVEQHGFDHDSLEASFRKVKASPPVLKAIQPPEPTARSWQAYRARFVDHKRITRGLAFWRRHEVALMRAQALYDVPAEIIVAIIGVETIYGEHQGSFDVFNALANLAFDYPPRAALFRGELEQLLLLAREQHRDPWRYRGSYAGAIGYPQFLPSSIRSHAVDFDRDGRIDLAASSEDAIGSVASFLNRHGWAAGGPISVPAKVSHGDTPFLLAEGIRPVRLPAQMAEFGVEAEAAPADPAALIDLGTPGGPTEYRLGYHNFYVLTRYNRSTFYAAAVADLAEALHQASQAATPSQPHEPALDDLPPTAAGGR